MVIREVLSRIYDSVHIGLHQVCDDVDVFESCLGRGSCNFNQVDDVLVIKEFQKLDLSDDTLCINQVLESLADLLDSNLDFALVIIRAANDTVCSMSDLFDIFKLLFDTESGSSAVKLFGAFVLWYFLLHGSLDLLFDLLLVGLSLVFDGLRLHLFLLLSLSFSSVLVTACLIALLRVGLLLRLRLLPLTWLLFGRLTALLLLFRVS